jgi:hypothetical protein
LELEWGPSNLALAIAIHEHQEDMEALFLEKKEHFDWHPNMMIPGSDLGYLLPNPEKGNKTKNTNSILFFNDFLRY